VAKENLPWVRSFQTIEEPRLVEYHLGVFQGSAPARFAGE
jgi:hypothetical protein